MQFFMLNLMVACSCSYVVYNTKKDISKFWPMIFVGFLNHLGIKNKCIVFIIGMCIVEISLHIVRFLENSKRVDFINIFLKKKSKILRKRNQKKKMKIQDSHLVARSFLHKLLIWCFLLHNSIFGNFLNTLLFRPKNVV